MRELYLIRHAISDKKLKNILSPEEFEMKRPLTTKGAEEAYELGKELKEKINTKEKILFVTSGKKRSTETIQQLAKGLELKIGEEELTREPKITYQKEEEYWKKSKEAVDKGEVKSRAEYFIKNPPKDGKTTMPEEIISNMKEAIQNTITKNFTTTILVSHEPVMSLFAHYLTNIPTEEIGGMKELECLHFTIIENEIILNFREKKYEVKKKIK